MSPKEARRFFVLATVRMMLSNAEKAETFLRNDVEGIARFLHSNSYVCVEWQSTSNLNAGTIIIRCHDLVNHDSDLVRRICQSIEVD